MNLNKIAVLTSKRSWFVPYARKLADILRDSGHRARLFHRYENIGEDFGTVFVLSYFRMIAPRLLNRHAHNLIVHESGLPKGRGGSPLFWQILEGKSRIPIVLFEATGRMDVGEIYLKDFIKLDGTELHDEIRHKQAVKTIALCLEFLAKEGKLRSKGQRGKPTYYKMRRPADSRLDVQKSIKDQFGLLRIASNRDFPAFFDYKGQKYILNIFKAKR